MAQRLVSAAPALVPTLFDLSDPPITALPAVKKKPLAERIREIWADMPDEVRAKLPADGASQHDHYIYGVPKKTL